MGPVKPFIDAMLRQDLDAPRKQRHTARRIRERLIAEHQVTVAYPTVRDYVRDARGRIAAEAGNSAHEVRTWVAAFAALAAAGPYRTTTGESA